MCVIEVRGDCEIERVSELTDDDEIASSDVVYLPAGQKLDVDIYSCDGYAADIQFPDGSTFTLPLQTFKVIAACGTCEMLLAP